MENLPPLHRIPQEGFSEPQIDPFSPIPVPRSDQLHPPMGGMRSYQELRNARQQRIVDAVEIDDEWVMPSPFAAHEGHGTVDLDAESMELPPYDYDDIVAVRPSPNLGYQPVPIAPFPRRPYESRKDKALRYTKIGALALVATVTSPLWAPPVAAAVAGTMIASYLGRNIPATQRGETTSQATKRELEQVGNTIYRSEGGIGAEDVDDVQTRLNILYTEQAKSHKKKDPNASLVERAAKCMDAQDAPGIISLWRDSPDKGDFQLSITKMVLERPGLSPVFVTNATDRFDPALRHAIVILRRDQDPAPRPEPLAVPDIPTIQQPVEYPIRQRDQVVDDIHAGRSAYQRAPQTDDGRTHTRHAPTVQPATATHQTTTDTAQQHNQAAPPSQELPQEEVLRRQQVVGQVLGLGLKRAYDTGFYDPQYIFRDLDGVRLVVRVLTTRINDPSFTAQDADRTMRIMLQQAAAQGDRDRQLQQQAATGNL